MRKLITLTILSVALSTSALAAPPNGSSDSDRGPIDRIIRVVNRLIRSIRPLGDIGQITPPIPH